MILDRNSIQGAIRKGDLTINPFNEENLKEASYTFTLASEIKSLKEGDVLNINEEAKYKEHIIEEDGFILKSGEFVIGYTQENLNLHGKYACILSARGSIAQKGLAVLLTDTFVEPDTNNRIALAMQNVSGLPIRLKPGIKIVKGIFISVA